MRRRSILAAMAAAAALGTAALAQTRHVASPPGRSATEVGGHFNEREIYVGGKWIEIAYGRPVKRGRDLFGPADYPDALADGAPVWRAGANVSTRLVTEVPLVIGRATVAPGEYTMFIRQTPKAWTLIVSSWPAQTTYDPNNKSAIWGVYDYTPDRDIVRAPMTIETMPHSFDQLSWEFLDMTATGGKLAILWDRKLASVAFQFR